MVANIDLIRKVNMEVYKRSGHRLINEGAGNYELRDKNDKHLCDLYIAKTVQSDAGPRIPNYAMDANIAFLLFGGSTGWRLESAGGNKLKITIFGFMNKQEVVGESLNVALLVCDAYLRECGINIWRDNDFSK